jgi:hypothetical protein
LKKESAEGSIPDLAGKLPGTEDHINTGFDFTPGVYTSAGSGGFFCSYQSGSHFLF